MEILPIAFDSLGTRSMATFVETDDIKILIDPGVSLAPVRYGLPPHALELKKLDESWEKIVKLASDSDILIITHYHYDHHNPWENLEIYKNKIVLIKHPTEKINFSQKGRAKYFLEQIKNLPKKLEFCDGKEFKFGRTRIKFSQPVFHGTNPKLGYVTEVLIENSEYKFLHTSDIEGPTQKEQVDFIIENKPNLVFLDGPLSYMIYRFGLENLEISIQNMIKIIGACPLESLIVEHHFLRDLNWKEKISKVYEFAERKKIKVQCVAEFLNKSVEMLEAKRKELYKKYPGMTYESKRKIMEE
ncbi:MAG: MBL fold metallo-hydrolase [Candidatus Aenigmatarchaeota archaeon]